MSLSVEKVREALAPLSGDGGTSFVIKSVLNWLPESGLVLSEAERRGIEVTVMRCANKVPDTPEFDEAWKALKVLRGVSS